MHLCLKKNKEVAQPNENRWNFPAVLASPLIAFDVDLQFLAFTSRMTAIALEFDLAFGRLTVGRTKLLARGHVAKTSIHRTLLRICSHSPTSWVLLSISRMQGSCAEMPDGKLSTALQ
jgi:hypothetical protein